ncbi:hypothetical protein PHYPSEUDO_015000 [Phytophthora pseudosyringae]|uniref:FHA domain-containing protein n=1 Tax=Phytophthora pseudosyringae TaxID=221518 RepID=A0A8T1WEN3_9STRA|nr:hypothetical protein PHYPSEUDO_015000 [Phytophthora pseudosyringae]
MPFLRSLEIDTSRELRSSKTLIGSGAATCDVVISGDNVLELHALLNLSADKATAKLVPFSTTEAGVCYVNDVVVPREGAVVIHGDRVAFGSARNAFFFELTPHPQMRAVPQQSIEAKNFVQHSMVQTTDASGNRAFRKALDTLRGDRKVSTPNASVAASIQSNLHAARNRSSDSSSASSAPPSLKSKDQLSKFLLEASSDSLLSDYVERKLKQRRSSQTSAVSSNKSENTRRSRASSSGRVSREQRNIAEVEKLRLSQRIREVNDVLNGDMDFQESYLSPSARSSRTRKPRWAVTNNDPTGRASVLGQYDEDTIADRSDEDNEEDEEDELPVMMERLPKSATPVNLSASIQTEHSDQESNSRPPSREESEEESGLLDYSLESMQSDHQPGSPNQPYNKPPKTPGFLSKAMALGLNDLTRSHSRPIKTARQEAAKTALQEKLINQTIRRKQIEIMREALVRWNRGLRIKSQNRERKAQQLERVSAALGKLRRDHHFIRWRDCAALGSQVMACRLEAFQQRRESRLARKCWTALWLNCMSTRQGSTLLRGLVLKKAVMTRYSAFRRWQHCVQKCSARNQLSEVQSVERRKLGVHLERMSERHYSQRIAWPLLTQILRTWKTLADQHKQQRRILRRVLVHGASKLAQRALRKWIEVALVLRHTVDTKKQTEQHIQHTTERLTSQHDQAQSALSESHAQQLQKLMVMIEEKDKELEQVKRQQRAEALEKAAAKTKREQDLHSFFKSAIVKCDEQIAQASDRFEDILQSADDDIIGARFGAAQFLVDSILQQKIHNTNECIRLQETKLSTLSDAKAPTPLHSEDPAPDPVSELSSNGRFLYDMIQQVNTFSLTLLLLPTPSNSVLALPFSGSRVCSSSIAPWPSSQRSPTRPAALWTRTVCTTAAS